MNSQRSQAQIEASRANGALSRGPITEEGKKISSQNGTVHGLLSNTVLIVGESSDEFNRLLNSEILHFEPQNDSEMRLVEEMVVCKWRQLRIWAMGAAALTRKIAAQSGNDEFGDLDLASRAYEAMSEMNRTDNTMDLLHRYEARFSRHYRMLRKDLIALREKRQGGN